MKLGGSWAGRAAFFAAATAAASGDDSRGGEKMLGVARMGMAREQSSRRIPMNNAGPCGELLA